jgi:hypothetical protein
MNLEINGENRTFDAPGDMPLLWVCATCSA